MGDVVEDDSHPEPVGRGRRPEVHGDVDDGPVHAADQLALPAVRADVQAADPTARRTRVTVLDERTGVQAGPSAISASNAQLTKPCWSWRTSGSNTTVPYRTPTTVFNVALRAPPRMPPTAARAASEFHSWFSSTERPESPPARHPPGS